MRHRTVAGLAALVALSGTLVFAGALAANADLVINFGSPTPAEGSTVAWTDSTITFAGTTTNTTDPADTINVMDYTTGSPDPMCVGLDPSSGAWSCDWAFSGVGAKQVRVEHTISGNSDVVNFTLGLPTQAVTGPAYVDAAGTINLTGTNGYPFGATIRAVVTTPNAPGLTCGPGAVALDGSWSCSIPFDAEIAPDSTATVTITQEYPGSADVVVTHDVYVLTDNVTFVSPPPTPDPYLAVWDAGNFFTLNGVAPTGNPVDVLLDGVPLSAGCGFAVPVSAAGVWDCGNVAIPVGQHSLIVQQLVGTVTNSDFRNIDILIPSPEVSGQPLSGMQSTTVSVGGTGALDGYEVHAWVTDGEAYDSCTDSTFTAGAWSCDLNLDGFFSGPYYTFTVEQYIVDNATIHSVQTDYSFEVTPYAAGTPAPLTCGFSPGGATFSSPVDGVYKRIYAMTEVPISSGGDYLDTPGDCGGTSGYPADFDAEYIFTTVDNCGIASCSTSDLTPGLYDLYYFLDDGYPSGGYSYEPFDYIFRVPETPAVTNVGSTTNSVLMRGTGIPGDLVRVVRPAGTSLCSVTVSGSGTWACAFPKSSTNSARVVAVDPSSGGISPRSAARSIPIATVAETEDAPLALVSWFLQFGGDLSNLKPGDKFTLNVSGMPVGTEIEVWIHSTPQLLGTATGTGSPMALDLQVPSDIETGQHEIEMIAVTPLGTHYFFTSDATVLEGATPSKPLDATPDEETPALPGQGGAGSGDHNDPGGASGISGTIAPLQVIATNPSAIAIAGGLALALLFLVALPTELLNSSLSSNTTRLGRVYGTVDRAMTRAQDWLIRVTRSRALVAVLLVVIVAFIYGFVDPAFGFNIVSLRLVLSLAVAFFLLSYVASWLARLVVERLWGAIAVVAIQPSIILFAILGVIVARILDFSPGFLVGVAIGLELVRASRVVAARAVFVQIAFVVGLSFVAWVVYSLFTPGNDFFGMLLEDTMVATTAEGLTGALIAVFPLKFLDGRELWEVSKRLWAAAFLIVATAFALLVLPTAIAGTDVADYLTWLIVFAVFGGLSLAVWIVFVRADRKASAAEKETVDA